MYTSIALTISGFLATISASPIAQAPAVNDPGAGGAAGGQCTKGVKFGVGFNGRTDPSFAPADPELNNSALRFRLIGEFVCNSLKNKGDQNCISLCEKALADGNAAPEGGAQADAFNKVFGVTTNFATEPVQNGQNNNNNQQQEAPAPAAQAPAPAANNAQTPAPAADNQNANAGAGTGQCTQGIKFGIGFNGRSENAFAPADADLNNSALRFSVIGNFVCGALKNKGDQNCISLCEKALADGNAAPTGGAQADAFNKVFGVTTNFATEPIQNGQNNNNNNNNNAQTPAPAPAANDAQTPAPAANDAETPAPALAANDAQTPAPAPSSTSPAPASGTEQCTVVTVVV